MSYARTLSRTLHFAALNGDVKLTKEILNDPDNHYMVSLIDSNGDLPLDRAVARGHEEIVKELIHIHVNTEYKYSCQNTQRFHPIIIAAYWWTKTMVGLQNYDKRLGVFNEKNPEKAFFNIMKELIQHYPAICKDVTLSTPDIVHQTNALYFIVTLLCEKNATTKKIKTHKNNATNIAIQLIGKGVSPVLKNNLSGMSALDYAKNKDKKAYYALMAAIEEKHTSHKTPKLTTFSTKPVSPKPVLSYVYDIEEPIFPDSSKQTKKNLYKEAKETSLSKKSSSKKPKKITLEKKPQKENTLFKKQVVRKEEKNIPFSFNSSYLDQILNEISARQNICLIQLDKSTHTKKLFAELSIFDFTNQEHKKFLSKTLKDNIRIEFKKYSVLCFFKNYFNKTPYFEYDINHIKNELNIFFGEKQKYQQP